MCAWSGRCTRCVSGGCLTARLVTQRSDGIQQLHAVPKRRDAKLLQVLVRQARKNRLVYVILAECRLVLPEAQAPQPDHNVHWNAPQSAAAPSSTGVSSVSRQTLLSISEKCLEPRRRQSRIPRRILKIAVPSIFPPRSIFPS